LREPLVPRSDIHWHLRARAAALGLILRTQYQPTAGFLDAQNLAIFEVGMEMGVHFEPQVFDLISGAKLWLRMVANGGIPVDAVAAIGSPSYRAPERTRCLQ